MDGEYDYSFQDCFDEDGIRRVPLNPSRGIREYFARIAPFERTHTVVFSRVFIEGNASNHPENLARDDSDDDGEQADTTQKQRRRAGEDKISTGETGDTDEDDRKRDQGDAERGGDALAPRLFKRGTALLKDRPDVRRVLDDDNRYDKKSQQRPRKVKDEAGRASKEAEFVVEDVQYGAQRRGGERPDSDSTAYSQAARRPSSTVGSSPSKYWNAQ